MQTVFEMEEAPILGHEEYDCVLYFSFRKMLVLKFANCENYVVQE